jgi:hypothetical protein
MKTCPLCRNLGVTEDVVGNDRWCTCEVALARKAQLDNDPVFQRRLAQLDYMVARNEVNALFVTPEAAEAAQRKMDDARAYLEDCN